MSESDLNGLLVLRIRVAARTDGFELRQLLLS